MLKGEKESKYLSEIFRFCFTLPLRVHKNSKNVLTLEH